MSCFLGTIELPSGMHTNKCFTISVEIERPVPFFCGKRLALILVALTPRPKIYVSMGSVAVKTGFLKALCTILTCLLAFECLLEIGIKKIALKIIFHLANFFFFVLQLGKLSVCGRISCCFGRKVLFPW